MNVKLWAPNANRAQVVIVDPLAPGTILECPLTEAELCGARLKDMRPAGDGYFVTELAAGTNYLLSIDGHQPLPDPRSAAQPWGVHGPSQVFDPAKYRWRDENWSGTKVLGDVIYELHIGTFTPTGTLDAAIDKLDYLVELGVKTVELMPVACFPGERGWGYDGVYWYGVQESYGGPAALQRFVDAAHQRGLAVCLDVVYNHFGPAGNYAPTFAPYLTHKYQTPWGDAINLDDTGSQGVRAFIIEAALRWLRDFHIDALRLDAVHALIDHSDTHILAELSQAVDTLEKQLGKAFTLIAESDLNQPKLVTPRPEGGLGIDGQWDDDIHHALHSYLTQETFGYYVDFGDPATLAKAVTSVFVHDGSYSTFREQLWGAKVADQVDRSRFVIFTQNHDQVGNRGQGDRPEEKLPSGASAAGAALVLLSPYTPMLFQGQEWASQGRFQFFTDHDEKLGQAVSQGRLEEFSSHGWEEIYGQNHEVPDPQNEQTFRDSKLDWDELEGQDHQEMLNWYRRLIQLRDQLKPAGSPEVDYGEDWLRMRCNNFTVVICPGDRSTTLPQAKAEILALWGKAAFQGDTLSIGANAAVVLAG